ncbi:hypothetical protein BH11BAC7_BH11BAC7_07300 [soil metagenome]
MQIPTRIEWPPILHKIMTTLDSCGRSDLADEIENKIKFNFTASEIFGETGLFLIKIKQTEKALFKKIQPDYDEYFKHLVAQGMWIGIDY